MATSKIKPIELVVRKKLADSRRAKVSLSDLTQISKCGWTPSDCLIGYTLPRSIKGDFGGSGGNDKMKVFIVKEDNSEEAFNAALAQRKKDPPPGGRDPSREQIEAMGRAQEITAAAIMKSFNSRPVPDIKKRPYAQVETIIRDGKIAAAIYRLRGKPSAKTNKNKMFHELLTPTEYDAVVRDALTPAELATMPLDANGLV